KLNNFFATVLLSQFVQGTVKAILVVGSVAINMYLFLLLWVIGPIKSIISFVNGFSSGICGISRPNGFCVDVLFS
ncbi:hypothetical protein, partial [Klebsiella pneumoniae]|uniref:hypothetical protein n=1 Tax=Klebsiella pneumoniae TaxID=573 RepID=UPI0021B0D447